MPSAPPTLLLCLKALPRPVWVLCAGTFVNKFGAFVIPFLALYLARQGYSGGDVSLTLAAYGVGHLFGAVAGGHLADSIGRRNTIALSMFTTAAAMLALSQAESLTAIIALTCLTGLTSELSRPATSALLADLVPPELRITAYAAYRVALNAGWACGPATAGFLAERSFQWLFIGDALTSALFGVLAWKALPPPVRRSKFEAPWPGMWPVIRRDLALVIFLTASLATALAFQQMGATFSLQITARGFSMATYGVLISLNGVLVVLLELPVTMITRRLPARPVMAVGYLLIGAGFALTAWAHSVPLLVLVVVVFTMGEIISMPAASAYLAGLAPEQYRGRYMGIAGFVWALAVMAGPAGGVFLFTHSALALWVTCGALGVFAALLILVKRTPRAPGEAIPSEAQETAKV